MNMQAPSGPLGFAEVPQYLGQLDQLATAGTLDLSHVTQADSAGLALLLELTRRARRRGASLRFAGAPPQLRELARFFRLDSVLIFEG